MAQSEGAQCALDASPLAPASESLVLIGLKAASPLGPATCEVSANGRSAKSALQPAGILKSLLQSNRRSRSNPMLESAQRLLLAISRHSTVDTLEDRDIVLLAGCQLAAFIVNLHRGRFIWPHRDL